MGKWVNYNPEEEVIKAKIDRGISAWVASLKERGLLNGELTEQDELLEYIVAQFEPEEEEMKGG